jgi:hypothetical protein
MTVDWNNMELFTALSAATWDLAKGHFTPQAKAKIVADLQAIDNDVTWNGLRYVVLFDPSLGFLLDGRCFVIRSFSRRPVPATACFASPSGLSP